MISSLRPRRRGQQGFTLIELLIVVAIMGVIAAILIPNLIDALQKANQKATIGDIRVIGIAWMSWVTDQVSAGAAGNNVQQLVWGSDLPNDLSHAQLAEILQGNGEHSYMQRLPREDGWGNPLDFRAAFDPSDKSTYRRGLMSSSHSVAIRSLGRDGEEENGGNYATGTFPGTRYNGDIVWVDAQWIRIPGSLSAAAEDAADGDGGIE